MSDIKQAANWMWEKYRVRRSVFPNGSTAYCNANGVIHCTSAHTKDRPFIPTVEDLLAEDWEIAAPPLGDGERA